MRSQRLPIATVQYVDALDAPATEQQHHHSAS
jgi:hypothetical protein